MTSKVRKVEVYQGADGDWRWRAKGGNGEVIADSAEGYQNKAHALAMAVDVTGLAATVVESE